MRDKHRIITSLLLASVAFIVTATALADSRVADLIESGRVSAASELIADGADVNAAQRDGTTPLHWAAYRVDVELVRQLLERGAQADVVNRFGATPLGEAVKAANTAIVELLLEAGADPDSANQDGQTALMLATRTGSVEIARLLLAHGADVNAREKWRDQTALMWAADGANAELVRLLIDHGADVRARATVNDWGSQITSEPRAQYRPTGGLTVLNYAARAGCADCVRAILAAGEDVDRPTPDGVTALMLALDNYEFDTADTLLDAGANPHYADWWGRTALYLAVDMNTYVPRGGMPFTRSRETSAMHIVRRLLAAGVDVDTQLNMHRPGRGGNSARFTDYLLTTGATPLLRAAIMHDHEALRALLDHGARVDLPNVMGVTPLMAAAGMGVRDIDFGANRSPNFEGDELIEDKVIASIQILLAAGADINAQVTDIHSRTARIARPTAMTDREGQTALYSAAERGWARVTRFLIENGAEVNVVDALGQSMLDVVLTPVGGQPLPNSDVVAEILRDAGARQGSAL
jgi:uncharacterized protein